MKFQSTKKFGPIPTTHRNWRAAENSDRDSVKCSWIHGYSRYVEIVFEGELDDKTWVWDFGNSKQIKGFLDKEWDHKVLVSSDDPKLDQLRKMHDEGLLTLNIMDVTEGWGPGIEASCKFVYDNIQPYVKEITNNRVRIVSVRVWEHEFNSALYLAE